MRENIVDFPDRTAIEEEAGAWLIKLDGDRAPSAEEFASLREWLERSPVHRQRLSSLADFWGKMNVLTELAVPLGHPEGGVDRSRTNRRRLSISLLARAGFAAAIVLMGIGVAATIWSRPDPSLSSNGLYATAVGQQQSTTLADGSVVLLNTNSQLKVDYGNGYRNIRLLQGEAHFTVARDSERPFRVYAGNGRVQAVGTAFSVFLKDNTVDVTVTEGRVSLASVKLSNTNQSLQRQTPPDRNQSSGSNSSGSNSMIEGGFIEALGTIKAGESTSIRSAPDTDNVGTINTIETVAAQEMAKRLSWRDGMLTFTGDSLEVVVDEISRYTTVSIEFSDPAVGATRIGGRFPIGETDAMFDALEANFGLRVTHLSHDRVLLSVGGE